MNNYPTAYMTLRLFQQCELIDRLDAIDLRLRDRKTVVARELIAELKAEIKRTLRKAELET